jgi:hypothetical protein
VTDVSAVDELVGIPPEEDAVENGFVVDDVVVALLRLDDIRSSNNCGISFVPPRLNHPMAVDGKVAVPLCARLCW